MTQVPDRPTLPLFYVARSPRSLSTETPLVLLLHGYGSNETDLLSFADHIPPGCLILSVRGPQTLGEGQYAWFSLDHTLPVRRYDKDEVAQSRVMLKGFLDEAIDAFGVDPSRVFLVGFSQGAIMSYAVALTHPGFVRGVAALSGRILEETHMDAVPQTLSVFLGHGVFDPVIPVSYAKEARGILESLGVDLRYREYPIAHGVSPEEEEELMRWLSELLELPRSAH